MAQRDGAHGGKSYSYSPWHRAFEIFAITSFAVFSAGNAWRIAAILDGPASWIVLGAAALTGYILADLVSGVVHWLADRYGTVHTPIFGPNFIKPFREHHVRPKEITTHDFIETNGANCIVSFWILVVLYFWFPLEQGDLWALFAFATLQLMVASVMATNQFHKWAHADAPPRWVQALQRAHLVLPPRHHDIHHTAPFDTYFCITTGWLNWPLQKLRVFEGLDWVMMRVFGWRAGEDDIRNVRRTALTAPGPAAERPSAP